MQPRSRTRIVRHKPSPSTRDSSALLEVDVWDLLEIVMIEAVLVVITSQRMENGIHATRTFLAKAHCVVGD
jgi:hypothetical protein